MSRFFGSRSSSEPPTAVYQVTRTGHDHCDVTEGNLLDITPQKIDGQKVVTLYDKDLTDGVNLLIGKNIITHFTWRLFARGHLNALVEVKATARLVYPCLALMTHSDQLVMYYV